MTEKLGSSKELPQGFRDALVSAGAPLLRSIIRDVYPHGCVGSALRVRTQQIPDDCLPLGPNAGGAV